MPNLPHTMPPANGQNACGGLVFGPSKDRHDSVLVLRMTADASSVRLMHGIKRCADEEGWTIRRIDCRIEDGTILFGGKGKDGGELDIASLIDLWRPVGLLADCGVAHTSLGAIAARKRLPVVFCDLFPQGLKRRVACISSDSESIAVAAFGELARLGFDHYAFVPSCRNPQWSVEREAVFRRLVAKSAATYWGFPNGTDDDPVGRMRLLEQWIGGLPKPCGVFAANDLEAERVISACQLSGLLIPEDIAVVGVDNRVDICESGRTSLTSVVQDMDACGYHAAKVLGSVVAGKKPDERFLKFGAAGIVRRASTRLLNVRDPQVSKAVEFIRIHASERIKKADVLRIMGCGRSRADERFKAGTGHSIIDELHERRVDVVKDLLAHREIDIKAIPDFSGFASAIDMRRVFKRVTGVTPGRFRKKFCR